MSEIAADIIVTMVYIVLMAVLMIISYKAK